MVAGRLFLAMTLITIGIGYLTASRVSEQTQGDGWSGIGTQAKLVVWVLCFAPALAVTTTVHVVGTVVAGVLLFILSAFFDFWFAFSALGLRPVLAPLLRAVIRLRDISNLSPPNEAK